MVRRARAALIAGVVAAGLILASPQVGATTVPPPTPAHPGADYLGSTTDTGPSATAQATYVPSGTPGLDVSHYQGTVDWNSVAAQGAKFAYMKATESTTYVDPQFAANYAGSANAHLFRGAYHFALPDRSSGAAQAMYFLNNGGGWVADGRTLPPVLDIEYNPYGTADWAGWCYGLSPAQLSAWISDFATTIHDRTNRWPVIYTTNGWWSNCTGNDAGFGTEPLWIAPSNSDAGGPPNIPASWSTYTFFQYATSGTFPGDQDVFNGSLDQLSVFAQGDGPDKIVAHYQAVGGSSSALGNPVGGEYPIAGGWAQDYEHGTIYYTPATGAWVVQGAVLAHYRDLGGPAGVLGFPTSDERATADGRGSYNDFAGAGGASIYWSSATGAWSIHGQIRSKWLALGGTQSLGFPVTDETGTPDGVGRYNHFNAADGASVYWSPDSGAHAVRGAIRARWAAMGWENGPGYPTTDESTTPDGVGRYNHFTRDTSIYWTANSGAHSVQGTIRAKWAALGWESGLGYPTTDESTAPDGVGRYNHFSSDTSIYWTPNTGAWSIGGAIRAKWAAYGWETGLGYPTTDENTTPDGIGRYNHFTKGASIYWTPSTGPAAIFGAIRDRWASLGWERSALGYPTTDEYSVTGGRRNDFQHGAITWYSSNGTTQVAYN